MTDDDVLFKFRLQVFDLAARTNVSDACRVFGIHRSTYYRWKKQVDASGLEMLRPRERRRPKMPNTFPQMIEARILAFSIANPGMGPRRVSAELANQSGINVSANGIWRVLVRHGLSTRTKRLALVSGYRAPYEPPREKQPEPRILTSEPGELIGIDCFFVGNLKGTKGTVWQLTGIDTYSSFGWGELVRCPTGQPTQQMTSTFAERIASELSRAGWKLQRVLTDNGNEFSKGIFGDTIARLGATQTRIRPGRPQTNGHVERLNRTILEECWRPAFAKYLQVRFRGLEQELETYLDYYNFDRAHTGRICQGRVPGEIVYGASKMEPTR